MAWLSTTQVQNAKICEFIPKSKRSIVYPGEALPGPQHCFFSLLSGHTVTVAQECVPGAFCTPAKVARTKSRQVPVR